MRRIFPRIFCIFQLIDKLHHPLTSPESQIFTGGEKFPCANLSQHTRTKRLFLSRENSVTTVIACRIPSLIKSWSGKEASDFSILKRQRVLEIDSINLVKSCSGCGVRGGKDIASDKIFGVTNLRSQPRTSGERDVMRRDVRCGKRRASV